MKIAKIIILILLVSVSSCRTQYVSVPEYHYETIVKTDSFIQRDSILCYDSVFMEKKGDSITIYKTKILYKDKWRERVLIDSVIKVDSILVPYPVERKLTKWEQMKMNVGSVSTIATLFIVFSFIVCWLVKKRS